MLSKSLVMSVVVSCLACGSPPELVDLLITGVTVIDPASEQIHTHHSVAIRGDRIVGLEPTEGNGSFEAPDTIDGTDRFLIPGLIDAHIHLFGNESVAEPTLDLLLANGITGFREMASDCWNADREGAVCVAGIRELAHAVEAGDRIAPRPLALASAPVSGFGDRGRLPEGAPEFLFPETAEDGRRLAEWLAGRGVDLVKVYNSVPREAYFALVEEATRLGLEVSGHLPWGVSVLEASAAGHRTLEHARDLPMACSDYSRSYRELMEEVVLLQGAERPSAQARMEATLDGFDEAVCSEVLAELARNDTYLVPTHGTREMDYRASDSTYRADDRMKYMLPRIRLGWLGDLNRTAEATPELVALYGEFYELGIRLTALAHAAGVKVLAGTDANDTMIFPGFGLHDELARFANAGIDEMSVLQTATSTSAEYLGRSNELGTVAVGALADLVLLGSDPLEDIGNAQDIEAVVLGGRVPSRADLDALLEGVEEMAGGGS